MAENLQFKKGSWWAYKTKDGKKKEKKLDTTNKSTAKKRRDQWFEELKATQWGEQPIPTLREAARIFVNEHMPRLKPKAAKRYETSLIHLLVQFGEIEIDKIRHAQLSEFENSRLDDGVTSSTIIKDLACLSSIYSYIQDMELVEKTNPVITYKRKRKRQGGLKDSEPRTRYLSHDEEERIARELSETHIHWYQCIIDEGFRRAENFLLKMTKVDLERERIKIAAGTSKNSKERLVPIKPRTLEYLKRRHNEEYAFSTYQGKPYSISSPTVWEALQKAARRAGVEDINIHDLRRTCGCRLLQDEGFAMHEVRDWLGHSSVTVTEKAYAFLKIDHLEKKMRNFSK